MAPMPPHAHQQSAPSRRADRDARRSGPGAAGSRDFSRDMTLQAVSALYRPMQVFANEYFMNRRRICFMEQQLTQTPFPVR
jgi:hypothetical protein